MVLFKNEKNMPHLGLILNGLKTETRRKSKKWQMGTDKIYSVQDAKDGYYQRNEDAVATIRCVERWEEELRDITEEGAAREGGNFVGGDMVQVAVKGHQIWKNVGGEYVPFSISDYNTIWRKINGNLVNVTVKVYRFKVHVVTSLVDF